MHIFLSNAFRNGFLSLAAVTSLCAGCHSSTSVPPTPEATEPVAARKSTQSRISLEIRAMQTEGGVVGNNTVFTEAGDCGIDFTYLNGASGKALMVESTGGGCAWLDFDRDGWPDLYLGQGGDPAAPSEESRPIDRLYRNMGNGSFRDVTTRTGIEEHGYGQGVAAGDYDNDGFEDIFVTNVGFNVLFHNQGDGSFQPVELTVPAAERLWSTTAAWGDIDRDGDLDLYVARYCDYDPYHPKPCFRQSGAPGTCHPKDVEPYPDEFYVNDGNGIFRPVARERGISGPDNRALGVAIADFDNDDWPDIFVANDTTMNFLFINRKDGSFDEQAAFLGCALNVNGSPQANMGIAVGDYDGNGFLDLYVTHFHSEWNTLYQNLGRNGFHDVTAPARLATPTMEKLGFGTVMVDFDQNGFQELIVANGHIDDVTDKGIEYEMKAQLFAYNGKTWDDTGSNAGAFFQKKTIGRAVATADYDLDGDLDVAYVPQNTKTALLRNDSRRGHWLKLRFVCKTSNRFGIGTRVTLHCGASKWMQELAGGTSYCCSHEPVLVFGLGELSGPCRLEIRWPNGKTSTLADVPVDRPLTVFEP
jgi:enediyne biosynthesis protein E4